MLNLVLFVTVCFYVLCFSSLTIFFGCVLSFDFLVWFVSHYFTIQYVCYCVVFYFRGGRGRKVFVCLFVNLA